MCGPLATFRERSQLRQSLLHVASKVLFRQLMYCDALGVAEQEMSEALLLCSVIADGALLLWRRVVSR